MSFCVSFVCSVLNFAPCFREKSHTCYHLLLRGGTKWAAAALKVQESAMLANIWCDKWHYVASSGEV